MAHDASSQKSRGDLSTLLDALTRPPPGPGARRHLVAGDRVQRFTIVRQLGRGGFGVVYEALDPELDRSVALKLLDPKASPRSHSGTSLQKEAQAAARLSHPGIVAVHEVGTSEHGPFLVMELLVGETLRDRLSRGPLPQSVVLDLGLQAARALAYAHERGVVHGDVNPANLFLCTDGRVRLLDFGLARLLGRDQPLAAGTPRYVAPEQWRGQSVESASDLFSLGVVLAEAISGKAPVTAGPGVGPVAIPAARWRWRRALVLDAVARCLSPDAARRPSAASLVLGLESAQRALARRRPLLMAAGAGVAALIAAMLWVGHGSRGPSEPLVTVAVADFDNGTPDGDLDSLSGLLVTSLEQWREVHALSRSRMTDVLRALGDGEGRIDEKLALEVARRIGASSVLVPAIRRFEDVYSIEIKGLDPASGNYVFSVKEDSTGKASLPGLLDRLAGRARRRLLGPLRASGVHYGVKPVTSDLEAYRHYSEALRYEDVTLTEAAAAELREALRLDPDFALAHLKLVTLKRFPLQAKERAAHLEAALEVEERLPEADRLVAHAELARSNGRAEEAETLYEEALTWRPDDKRWLLRLAELRRTRLNLAAALPLAEQALVLDPAWAPARDLVAIALVNRGDFDRAEALSREALDRWPSPLTAGMLNGVLLHAGRPHEALVQARRMAELAGGTEDLGVLVRTFLQLHDLEPAAVEGERLWRRGIECPTEGPGLAVVRVCAGRRADALRLAAAAERSGKVDCSRSIGLLASLLAGEPGPSLEAVRRGDGYVPPHDLALVSVLAGDPEGGERLLARSIDRVGSSGDFRVVTRGIAHAARSRQAGDIASARRELEALHGSVDRVPGHLVALALGEVCLSMGDASCAHAAFTEFLAQHWSLSLGCGLLPSAFTGLARAEELLGRRSEALQTVGDFLAIWKNADPDLPALAEARALRARLTTRASAGP